MADFAGGRLSNRVIKLDTDSLRRGYYSDKYFENVVRVLEMAHQEGYHFGGEPVRPLPDAFNEIDLGDIVVEAQYFNRQQPFSIAAGVDVALAMVRFCSGYYEAGQFVETWDQLDVEAIHDGTLTQYDGDVLRVQPAIKIRGCYRDFALLETGMLGVMSRATRVATNVYRVLEVSNGKPLLFFPARFDIPEVQMIDGYAYWIAVQRYNHEYQQQTQPLASTDAQSAWWGGQGGGTVPHALIACFAGDTAEAMVAYARYLPVTIPRIVLVDFNNDSVGASLATAQAFWPHYRAALEADDDDGQRRWTLDGVRLDTSKNVRDRSMEPDGPYGISIKLVHTVREALDHAWEGWDVPDHLVEVAQTFCKKIKIVVSGGFNRERIEAYEQAGAPVDIYGVGSSLFQNDKDTNADYSMDIVRLKINDEWVNMAKVGRQPSDNPQLVPVDLAMLE